MNIVVFGGTSEIAHETLKYTISQDTRIVLVGRNEKRLVVIKEDLLRRGAAEVEIGVADLIYTENHGELIDKAWKILGHVDLVVVAYGVFVDQKIMENSNEVMKNLLISNLVSPMSLILKIVKKLEVQRNGHLVAISSVAGEVGRSSNYIYGASKAGLSIFMQGLRQRLFPYNIHVTTVKPGPVRTQMIQGRKIPFFSIEASLAGKIIASAIRKKKEIAYVPSHLFWLILALKLLPDRFIKRFKL